MSAVTVIGHNVATRLLRIRRMIGLALLTGMPAGVLFFVTFGNTDEDIAEGNRGGSYLTFMSTPGLMFGIINIVGNFGTVFVDQSYWQSAIAASPASAHKGYLLGGLVWFTIPFTLATSLGLAANALNVAITSDDANAGLVPPAAAAVLVGRGGAVFPTAQKLAQATTCELEFLVLNGAECEPYISCDDVLMREHAADIVSGGQILMHALQVDVCFIVVESDKPDALQQLAAAMTSAGDERLSLKQIPTIYPSGGEDQLVLLVALAVDVGDALRPEAQTVGRVQRVAVERAPRPRALLARVEHAQRAAARRVLTHRV